MSPREQDEFEFEDNVGVGDVEMVFEVCRRKESGKLQRQKKKMGRTGKRDTGAYISLHVFLACSNSAVAESHAQLCGGGIDFPGREI